MSLTKANFRMIDAQVINAFDYGVVGDGIADDTAAFNLAKIAASGKNLRIDGVVRIASNILIQVDVQLDFVLGGMIKLDAGIDMTIQGSWQAGMYQIFDVSAAGSSITSGSAPGDRMLEEVYPQWWGVTDADTAGTANTAAMNACLAFGKTVVFTRQFNVDDTINYVGQKLRGERRWLQACGLNFVGTKSTSFSMLLPSLDASPVEMSHITLAVDPGATLTGGITCTLLNLLGNRFNRIEMCRFIGRSTTLTGVANYRGINLEGNGAIAPFDQWFNGNTFDTCDTDIRCSGTVSQPCIGLFITENSFGGDGRDLFTNLDLVHSTAVRITGNIFNSDGVTGGTTGAYNVKISQSESSNIVIRGNHFDGGTSGRARVILQSTVVNTARIIVDEADIGSGEVLNETGSQMQVFDQDWLTFTPAFTDLIETGAPTHTGRYRRRGTMVDLQITLNVGAVGTTQSTAGTTIMTNLPVPIEENAAGVCSDRGMSFANVACILRPDTNQRVYTPTWAQESDIIFISAAYEVL